MRTSLRRLLIVGAAAASAACLLAPSASATSSAASEDDTFHASAAHSRPEARAPRADDDVRAFVTNPRQVIALAGTDQRLWVKYTNQPNFFNYGGLIYDTPAIALAPNANYFIGVGGDGNLWIRSDKYDWQRFGPLNTRCAGPGAVVSVDTLAVICRGGDNGMWVAKTKLPADDTLPQVSGFVPLDGRFRGGASVSDFADYSSPTPQPYFLYAGLGTDSRPYVRDDATAWEQMYTGSGAICGDSFSVSEFFESAACKSATSGNLNTFMLEDGAGIGFAPGNVVGRPGVAVDADLVSRFYVLGTDRNVYVATQNREWANAAGFKPFGGSGLYGVAAASFD